LFFITSLGVPASLYAQIANAPQKMNDIIYQADVIQADLDQGSALLKGNVVIYFEGYKLTAPEAEIIKAESRFTARGGVRIENLMTQMTAENVEIFFDNNTGILKNARIESGQMLLEAKEIRKLDKEVFEADKSYFTTCTTCPPLVRFGASHIKTNIKKYVDIRWGTFQVANQPILLIPRLILPVNTRRKTGLLPPGFISSTSRGQLGIEQGYFWAISDNRDLTFTPKIYNKSGIKTVYNYRHLFDSRSKLETNFGYMNDNHFNVYNFANSREDVTHQSRWFLEFENQLFLPNNFIQKSNIRLLSDLIYLSDFPDEIKGQRDANIENQISLIKNEGNNHFSTEIVYNINLLTEDYKSPNLDSVHRTPQIRYSRLNSVFLKNFRFSLDTEYNKFFRRGLSYDAVTTGPSTLLPKIINTSPSGSFDPSTDLIRAGHRLFIQPKVIGTFNINNKLIVLPKLSLNEGLYSFAPEQGTSTPSDPNRPFSELAHRSYIEGELEFKTQMSKVFNKRWKHILEPSMSYIHGDVISETDHLFFQGTRDLPYYRRFQPINDSDFFDYNHGVQFDYYDRIEDTHVAKIALLQTFLRKETSSDVDYYTQPIFLELSQNYDFINAKRANPDPWSTLNALIKIKTENIETFSQVSHFHKLKKTNFSTRNKYIYKDGHFISTSYKNNYIISRDNSIKFHQEFVGLGMGWKYRFLTLSGEVLYSTLDSQVQKWQSRLGYAPPGDCLEIFVNMFGSIDRRQANRPEIKFDFVWNFGQGNEKPSDIQTVF
jgi:LPS-assembly protein